MNLRSLLASAALSAFAALGPAAAGSEGFGPFGSHGSPLTSEAVFAQRLPRVPGDVEVELESPRLAALPSGRRPAADPFERHFLQLTFGFYRDWLTRMDGPRCAHQPVCSVYARDAVRRYGLLGFGLGIDRLWRGRLDSPLRRLPRLVLEDGRVRLYDPLEFSTFEAEEP